jgi:hypothetical protein
LAFGLPLALGAALATGAGLAIGGAFLVVLFLAEGRLAMVILILDIRL